MLLRIYLVLYYLLIISIFVKAVSLFPEENILTKEIYSWRVFAENLKSEEDKKLFLEMLEKCQKYSLAINAKGLPFPTEPLIMAMLLQL
jgi:hypothetical protein